MHIVSAGNSRYISFVPGVVIPLAGYIALPDTPAAAHEPIGNTAQAEMVKKGATLYRFELMIEYHGTWRWDLKNVPGKLEIVFISPGGSVLSGDC